MNLIDMKEELQVFMLINYFGKKITMGNVKMKVLNFLVYFAMIWVITAISFNTYMLYLHFSDQNQKIRIITNKMDETIDKIR